ncbi:MAG: hypothetical protein R6U26_04260 [Candidatus Undinarchaeales archaeon]
MRQQEIKKLIEESRKEGGITALEEYDRTRKLPFEKERVSFTIERSVLEKFREKYKGKMSSFVEDKIKEVV